MLQLDGANVVGLEADRNSRRRPITHLRSKQRSGSLRYSPHKRRRPCTKDRCIRHPAGGADIPIHRPWEPRKLFTCLMTGKISLISGIWSYRDRFDPLKEEVALLSFRLGLSSGKKYPLITSAQADHHLTTILRSRFDFLSGRLFCLDRNRTSLAKVLISPLRHRDKHS